MAIRVVSCVTSEIPSAPGSAPGSLSYRPQCGGRNRLLALALVGLLIVLSLGGELPAKEIHWNGNAGNGLFFDGNNWSPVGSPVIDDVIRIGNLPGTAGDDVLMGGDPGILHGGLHLSNGVTLDANGSEVVSFEVVSLNGDNTRLIARPALGPNTSDLQGQIQMGEGTFLELHDNVSTVFFPDSWSHDTISGRGTMITNNFDNSGVIRPGNNGGIVLNAGQLVQTGQVNLDGSTGEGLLDLTSQFSELHVNAGNLTESFSGGISMAPGALLNMNVFDGWIADSFANINVIGFFNVAASQISGSHMTLGGTVNVTLAEGKLRILAPLTVESTALVNVGHTDRIEFDGETTVEGGSFSLGQFGEMQFDGPTTLSGGTFSTFANNYVDGTIAFNGPTTWNGSVAIQGAARQQGNATVSGLGATINANRFDMDGLSGDTVWNINSNLTVNAEMTGTTPSNRFDGAMNIQGGALPRLNLNLADPNASWVMAGEMNLSGTGPSFQTRVSGSKLEVEGDVNVTGGRVRIDADATFSDAGFAGPAEATIGPEDAALRMHGTTVIESGVVFAGEGTLVNAESGRMLLESGASLASVDLVNSGVLEIDRRAGIASVDGFENSSTATWSVDIGGLLAGAQHDLLQATADAALLDGLLDVDLVDLGTGLFLPEIGNQFTILTSVVGVGGQFLNHPVSHAAGRQFHWTVLYNPNDVILELTAISVPEPAAVLLLGLAAMPLAFRRRRKAEQQREILVSNPDGLYVPTTRGARCAGVCLGAMVLAAGWGTQASAAFKSWNTGNDSWGNPANWSPAGVPGVADIAQIGNLPGVQDHTVFGDQDVMVAGITLTDGMALQTEGHRFTVLGDTILNGDGTRLNISDTGPGVDFITQSLTVSGNHARVLLEDATVRVNFQLTLGPESELSRLFPSDGLISLAGAGGVTFINGGRVVAGSGHMSLVQTGGGLYDLDGPLGNGELRLTGELGSSMAINGQGLSDAFSGKITLGRDAILQMNLDDGWEADASSTIEASTFSVGTLSRLGGDAVRLAGAIDVKNVSNLSVLADATLAPTANVTIDDGASLDFDLLGSAVVEGGDYAVGSGGLLRFRGPTTIQGGAFNTAGIDDGQGEIKFDGPTTWAGNVTINGRARQNGNARVTAPTIINAALFDMSGENDHTNWDIESALVINAADVSVEPFDFFEGVMNIGGSAFSRLTINFDGSAQQTWIMSGELNLAGSPSLFVRRIAGSPISLGGTVNISDSKVEIASDTYLQSWGTLNFATPNSELRTRGFTYVGAADFNGAGTLRNGIGGEMRLDDGTALGDVGLVNQGLVRLAGFQGAPAVASVDRFTNDDDGTVQFRLGGYNLGDEFDHLSVTGGSATLDGLIDVLLIDDGDGQFLPQIGDEFLVLASVGGVSGQFFNDPVSQVAGRQFHWTVLYHPFDVTLRLDAVTVPEPASLSAALVAMAAILQQSRSRRCRLAIPW